jgi:5-methylcytosine-specific restriction endonuclease McrA
MAYKDPEAKRANDRAYGQAHKPQHNLANKAWRARNSERLNAKRRAKYAANPTPELLQCAVYRKEHPKERLALILAYAKRNPEKVNARNARYHYRRKGSPVSDLTAEQWKTIQESQDHRCAYCGRRAKGHLHREHLTPVVESGSTTLHNIVAACPQCNSKKGTGPVLCPVQPLLL